VADSNFCHICGQALGDFPSVYSELSSHQQPVTPKPASSSGRQPMDTSPGGREAYFRGQGLPPPQEGGWLAHLGEADEMVELTERDLREAEQAMRDAAADFGPGLEHAHNRTLSGETWEAYRRWRSAHHLFEDARAAHELARLHQADLLAAYDPVAGTPLQLRQGGR
jgi:hypothetical protein